MTCSQMGGSCEEKITGGTQEEMIENGMKHLEEKHPEMAANVKSTPKEDPMMEAWYKKFKADFEAAPEV